MTDTWTPPPGRLPVGQYTVTLVMTGDDPGPDAIGWALPPLILANLGLSSVHVVEIRRGYAEPRDSDALREKPARPVVRIHSEPDYAVRVYVDGRDVGHANYDEHGWSGITGMTDLATAIAAAASLDVVFCEGDPGEPRCADGDHDV